MFVQISTTDPTPSDLNQGILNPQAAQEITLMMIYGAINLSGTIGGLIESIQKNLTMNSRVICQILGRSSIVGVLHPSIMILTDIGQTRMWLGKAQITLQFAEKENWNPEVAEAMI